MTSNYKICTKCVCDTSIPGISFDDIGICNFCTIHDEMEKQYPIDESQESKLNSIVKKIKIDGKNREYDCIIGVSGGTDSSYLLYTAIQLGLKPLAVHYDNGWNSLL